MVVLPCIWGKTPWADGAGDAPPPELHAGASECAPGIAFAFMALRANSWICCPRLPYHLCKNGDAQHMFCSTMADGVNSSPPLISRKFQGFCGIWANSGKIGNFRENSGEFSGVRWGLHGAQYELSGNSWGISGQRRVFGWFRAIWGLRRLLRKYQHHQGSRTDCGVGVGVPNRFPIFEKSPPATASFGFLSGKKKAHKHKVFGPVALGTTPGLSQGQTGFVPGTNPLCPRDKPGFSPYFTQLKPSLSQGQTGFVPGTIPETKGSIKS